MTTTASTTKPVTKIVTLTLNGFHGYQTHRVRASFVSADPDMSEPEGYFVTIADSAAAKFACKGDCRCGESMPTEFCCDDYDFEHADITVKGNYPQR